MSAGEGTTRVARDDDALWRPLFAIAGLIGCATMAYGTIAIDPTTIAAGAGLVGLGWARP